MKNGFSTVTTGIYKELLHYEARLCETQAWLHSIFIPKQYLKQSNHNKLKIVIAMS